MQRGPRRLPWRRLLLLLLLAEVAAAASAASLKVTVLDEAGGAVADAIVVLMELDATLITDKEGTCTFPNVPAPPFGLYASAAGFQEKRQRVESLPPGSVKIVLQAELVQMEGVKVEAENPNPNPTAAALAFGREDLLRWATGGDPAALADYALGTSFPLLALGSGSPAPGDLPTAAGNRGRLYASGNASVYGADPDLDAWAFGGIELPAARHPLTSRSILPIGALQGFTAYRGVGPVAHAPVAGSLYVLQPAADIPSGREMSAGVSLPGSLDFLGRFPISKDAGLTVSLRKSFFEAYGGLAAGATGAVDASATDVLLSDGDMLVSFLARGGAHELRLDAVGFYDAAMEWPKGAVVDPAAVLFSGDQALTPGADGLGFAGLGAVWDWSPSDSVANTLSAFGSLYAWRSRLASYDASAQRFVTGRIGSASAWTASLSDAAQWTPTEALRLSGGLQVRYESLAGEWNGTSVVDEPSVLLAYPHAELRWRAGNLLTQSGAGLYWLPLGGALGPVLSQEVSLFIPPGWSAGLKAAWGAGLYGASAFLARRILEDSLGMAASSATTLASLPKAVTVEGFVQNDFSPEASASLKPWFAWRYDLRGYSPLAAYVEENAGTRTLRWLHPREGCAAGCDLALQAGGDALRWTAGYTLGWSLLRTEELAWVSANGDARHTLRAQASWKPTADLQAAAGLLVLLDLPHTAAGGTFNGARDWLPRQRLDLSLRWDLRPAGLSGSVFAGATNVLCFLNPLTDAAGAAAPAVSHDAPFAAVVGSAAFEIGANLRF